MFHFPSLPLTLLFIEREMTGHYSSRVSPFGNPRIEAWLAAPRDFSQPPTTFIGFWCLGIRHLHLLICFYIYYKDARVHCVVLKVRGFLLSDLPLNSGVGDSIIAIESAQVSLRQAQKALEELEASNTVLSNLNQVFSRFVPGAFLDSLGLRSPLEAQLGAHKSTTVSVMFGDLRGFTGLSERMTAAEIFAFLNRFLAFVAPNIRNNGGFVVHYVGDGVLALFSGAPDNSVQAAVDMQRALTDAVAVGGLGDFLKNKEAPRLGIGLSFGTVEMGIIGESGRWDPAVISDAVNVAARLQELSKAMGAQILATSELQKGMKKVEGFHMRRVGMVKLHGRDERVEVLEVLDGLPLADRTLRILNRRILEGAIHDLEAGHIEKGRDALQKYLKICPTDSTALYYLSQ